MITSPVITPAGGANHHIEVLAVIPANVLGSMTAAVMAFLLGIIHSVAPSWLCRLACFSQLAPSSPARRIAAVTRLPRAAPL
jgi:fructose-specific phosphotransferase system IIC component